MVDAVILGSNKVRKQQPPEPSTTTITSTAATATKKKLRASIENKEQQHDRKLDTEQPQLQYGEAQEEQAEEDDTAAIVQLQFHAVLE